MKPPDNQLAHFVVRVLVLLVVALALWQFSMKQILALLVWCTDTVGQLLFAEHVIEITPGREQQWRILTSYVRLDDPAVLRSLVLDPVRYTAALPLLWALMLGTPGARRLRNLILGSALLTGAIVILLMEETLFQLLLIVGPRPIIGGALPEQYVLALPFDPVAAYGISLVQGFTPLLIPLLAITIWAALNLRFLCEVTGSNFFPSPIQGADLRWSKFKRWGASGIAAMLLVLVITNYDYRRVQFNRAMGVLIGGNPSQGMEQLTRLAESGYAKAQFFLGVIYADRGKDPGIPVEAKELIQSAAQQDDIAAQYFLAELYASGQRLEQDTDKALYWYRRAAERGFVPAQFQLGNLLADMSRTDGEAAKAAHWMSEAANKNHVQAMRTLAKWFQDGRLGLPKDSQLAEHWRNKSMPITIWQQPVKEVAH